jgi:hypothetical protein
VNKSDALADHAAHGQADNAGSQRIHQRDGVCHQIVRR